MGSEQAIRLPMTGPNMLAALEGRKGMTRRVGGLARVNKHPEHWRYLGLASVKEGVHVFRDPGGEGLTIEVKCPYGVPGDPLVLTETWRPRDVRNIRRAQKALIEYRADGKTLWLPIPDLDAREKIERALKHGKWLPPMFMQAWASRAPAVNEEVRVERVQEISFADIRAEGIECPVHDGDGCFCASECADLRAAWVALWDSINAKRGYPFASNPWLWALTFKLLKGD